MADVCNNGTRGCFIFYKEEFFMKKSKLTVVVAMLLALVMVVAACTREGDGGTIAGAGEDTARTSLTVAMGANPSSLDGNGRNDSASITIRRQMYNTLIAQDYDMSPIPALATSWEFLDDVTIQFEIRQGVRFHNGELLKASDVAFSLERAFELGFASAALSMVDFSQSGATGEYQYTLVLQHPFAPILSNLAAAAAAIVHEGTARAMGDDNNVGTGPFKYGQWIHGDRIELVRFDDYWGTPPAIESITFRIITEPLNRAIEVETGGVDIALEVAPSDVRRLEEHDSVNLIRNLNLSTTYIGFTYTSEPLDNVLVRQAISHALDLESIVEAVFFGVGAPAQGFISPMVWGYSDAGQLPEFNPDRSRELLEQAGFGDGLDTVLWTSDNQVRIEIAEIAQNQLRQVGINAEVRIVEWASFLSAVEFQELDIFILGIGATTGDADALFSQFHSTSHFSANTAHFRCYDLDVMLEASRVETNPARRLELLEEIQVRLAYLVPWMPISHGENTNATRLDVRGFRNHPTGTHFLGNVYFVS